MEVLKSFTNTDSEDFECGFHGEMITVKAGESKTCTEKLAKHLARALAYKIGVRKGAEFLTPEAQGPIMESFVGTVDIPVVAPKVEPVVVEDKPKEEEFADIKPKKTRKKK